MKRPGVNSSASRHPNNNIYVLSPAVMSFCKIIYDLVETTSDKISELHLHDRLHAVYGKPKSGAEYSRFAERRITDSFSAKLFHKSQRGFEHSAIFRNILTHDDKILIFTKSQSHGISNSVKK